MPLKPVMNNHFHLLFSFQSLGFECISDHCLTCIPPPGGGSITTHFMARYRSPNQGSRSRVFFCSWSSFNVVSGHCNVKGNAGNKPIEATYITIHKNLFHWEFIWFYSYSSMSTFKFIFLVLIHYLLVFLAKTSVGIPTREEPCGSVMTTTVPVDAIDGVPFEPEKKEFCRSEACSLLYISSDFFLNGKSLFH